MLEAMSHQPWLRNSSPRKILIIRLHAIGDVAVTFSACAGIRDAFPTSRIDFLTTESCYDLVRVVTLFDDVRALPDIHYSKMKIIQSLPLVLSLLTQGYDMVIDLQRNNITRFIRKLCNPSAWCEFDRFSENPVEKRIMLTIEKLKIADFSLRYRIPVDQTVKEKAYNKLTASGWDGSIPLIVFNPAGLWETRNWPLEYYFHLGSLILNEEPKIKFLFVGTGRIANKAKMFEDKFPNSTINLSEKTGLGETLGILYYSSGVLGEDSGLALMAWVLGIPTLSLIGSSRHNLTPFGSHAKCLHSGDLECGNCSSPKCKWGDVRCLTRYRPEEVFKLFWSMISTKVSA